MLIFGIFFCGLFVAFIFGCIAGILGVKDKMVMPVVITGAIIGVLVGIPFNINTANSNNKKGIADITSQSSQLGEFINYANNYYKNNKAYGSLDAISLEFPDQFTDQAPLEFSSYSVTTDYRVNKIPTGAIIIYNYDNNFTLTGDVEVKSRILLKKGEMVGISCTVNRLVDNVDLCKIAKKEIRMASQGISSKRVSCSKNNLTAEECAKVNSVL